MLCGAEDIVCAPLFPPLQAPPAVPGICSCVQCTHPRALNQLIWALTTSQQPSSKREQRPTRSLAEARLHCITWMLSSRAERRNLHWGSSAFPWHLPEGRRVTIVPASNIQLYLCCYISAPRFFFPFILMHSPSSWVEHISALHSHLPMKKTRVRLRMSWTQVINTLLKNLYIFRWK